MSATPPAPSDLRRIIHDSTACFWCGCLSLLPVLGGLIGPVGLLYYVGSRTNPPAGWNPTAGRRRAGLVLNLWGLLTSLLWLFLLSPGMTLAEDQFWWLMAGAVLAACLASGVGLLCWRLNRRTQFEATRGVIATLAGVGAGWVSFLIMTMTSIRLLDRLVAAAFQLFLILGLLGSVLLIVSAHARVIASRHPRVMIAWLAALMLTAFALKSALARLLMAALLSPAGVPFILAAAVLLALWLYMLANPDAVARHERAHVHWVVLATLMTTLTLILLWTLHGAAESRP